MNDAIRIAPNNEVTGINNNTTANNSPTPVKSLYFCNFMNAKFPTISWVPTILSIAPLAKKSPVMTDNAHPMICKTSIINYSTINLPFIMEKWPGNEQIKS